MATKQSPRAGRMPVIRESVEQVWLAGLGALALAEEEGSKLFRTLVKRGEGLEQTSRKQLRAMTERARSAQESTMGRIGSGIDETMASVLHRLGVPTERDINRLTRRVEALTDTLAQSSPTTRKRAAAASRSRPAAGRARKTTRTTRKSTRPTRAKARST
jgi:poly(hydroxyalkanoate) granule-associated protein